MTMAPSIPKMPVLGGAFNPREFCAEAMGREHWLDGPVEVAEIVWVSEAVTKIAAPDSMLTLLRLHALGLWRAVDERRASFVFEGTAFEQDAACSWEDIQEVSHLLDGRVASIFEWGTDYIVIWSQTSEHLDINYEGEDHHLVTKEPTRVTFAVTSAEYSNQGESPEGGK